MFLKKIKQFNNSLIFRLTVVYSLVFALLACIGFGTIYYKLYSFAIEEIDSELLHDTTVFTDLLNGSNLEEVSEIFIREVENEEPQEEFYRLLSPDGSVLFSTDMQSWQGHQVDLKVHQLETEKLSTHIETVLFTTAEKKARVVTSKVNDNLYLQIGESLDDISDYLAFFQNLFITLFIFLTIAAIAIGWLTARWALTGLGKISATATEIADGDYQKRVDPSGQMVETRRLTHSFNMMVDRITGMMVSMREVNDSIAHDLRSPLTRIRGIAEMTLADEKPVSAFRDMASSTIEECDQLIALINTMLDITETEAGMAVCKKEEFDIVKLANDACELFLPLAEEKEISLHGPKSGVELFIGDKKRMQRVVTNLLENAIKYTKKGGSVSVLVEKDHNEFSISVKDNGIGIARRDLPNIYDRFYRGDKSRTGGGFGLGLSLAKAYTESMNGRIEVQSNLDKGSIFTLLFDQKQQVLPNI